MITYSLKPFSDSDKLESYPVSSSTSPLSYGANYESREYNPDEDYSYHVLLGNLFAVSSSGEVSELDLDGEYAHRVGGFDQGGNDVLVATGMPEDKKRIYKMNTENLSMQLIGEIASIPVSYPESYPLEIRSSVSQLNSIRSLEYCGDDVLVAMGSSIYLYRADGSITTVTEDSPEGGIYYGVKCTEDGKYLVATNDYLEASTFMLMERTENGSIVSDLYEGEFFAGREERFPLIFGNSVYLQESIYIGNDSGDRKWSLYALSDNDGQSLIASTEYNDMEEFVSYSYRDGLVFEYREYPTIHRVYEINSRGELALQTEVNFEYIPSDQYSFKRSYLERDFKFKDNNIVLYETLTRKEAFDLKAFELNSDGAIEIFGNSGFFNDRGGSYKNSYRVGLEATLSDDIYFVYFELYNKNEYWVFDRSTQNWQIIMLQEK